MTHVDRPFERDAPGSGARADLALLHIDPGHLKVGDPVLVLGEVRPVRGMIHHNVGGRTLLFDHGRVVRVHEGPTVVVPVVGEETEPR